VIRMRNLVPEVTQVSAANVTSVLKSLIFNRATVCRMAKFAHQVLTFFDTVPVRHPNNVNSGS
jgi:hypothetical protein